MPRQASHQPSRSVASVSLLVGIIAGFGGIAVPACGGTGTPGSATADEARSDKLRVTDPSVSPDDAAQLAADNLALAADLHQRMRAATDGNFVFSQPSLSIVLAMLYAGARANTAAQMATALHFGLPAERLHAAFDALDLALNAAPSSGGDGAFRLSVVNATWTQTGFPILPDYLDTIAENYGSGMRLADFAANADSARETINGWVSDQTERQIPELFPAGSINPLTVLVLANAVFFHGDWAQPFQPDSPSGTFHAAAGDVSVPMMRGDLTVPLWSGPGYSAAALPYVGGTTSMIVVVPDAGTFDSFEGGLTADQLSQALSPGSQGVLGAVMLPRFKVSTTPDMVAILNALGMTDAFIPGTADLSGIAAPPSDLFLQTVAEQAIISVDEKGTTAAAASGAVVGRHSATLNQLVADRPFLFFVRHDPTGAILFQGRVVDPSAGR